MEINPAEPPAEDQAATSPLDALVGISVVLLATFLGICSVKSGNIAQQMEQAQSDRNNMWLWFQARNLREEMYQTAADQMRGLAGTSASAELAKMIDRYEDKAKDQAAKKQEQFDKAEKAQERYKDLGEFDDAFDVCEAALTLGLALMGVTALLKRFWLYVVALIPSAFGVFMGVAGFCGWAVPLESIPVVGDFFRMIL